MRPLFSKGANVCAVLINIREYVFSSFSYLLLHLFLSNFHWRLPPVHRLQGLDHENLQGATPTGGDCPWGASPWFPGNWAISPGEPNVSSPELCLLGSRRHFRVLP